jgi:cell division protein FtsB
MAAPLLAVLVLFYLCFHAVSGERGVVALFKESRKLEELKAELAEVVAERETLDAKVHGLSSNSLDLDLLDERARLVLGMAGKNEVVYFLGDK